MSTHRQGNVLDPRLMSPDATPLPGYNREGYGHGSTEHAAQRGPIVNQPYYTNPARTTSGSAAERDTLPETQEEGDSPGGAQESPVGDDAKRSRACEACRGLKVRCDQDPAQPDRPCKRCAKAGRQCLVTQPSRKRQKKADNRVADLEKKLDALTAALHAQQGGASVQHDMPNLVRSGTDSQLHGQRQSLPISGNEHSTSQQRPTYPPPLSTAATNTNPFVPPSSETPATKKRKAEESSYPGHAWFFKPVSFDPDDRRVDHKNPTDTAVEAQTDVRAEPERRSDGLRDELYYAGPDAMIARVCQMVDPALHERIFQRYIHELSPHIPAIVFAPGTTAKEVLESRPILFLAILAAASTGLTSQQTQVDLTDEVSIVISDCAIRHAIKSLELVQAMLISILWYRPPEKWGHANFYLVIHMAATMALDLGLGRKAALTKPRKGFSSLTLGVRSKQMMPPVDSDSMECRRTWLTCYYLCASASQTLRRPNLIRWSKYLQECIDALEASSEAAPTDRLLTQFIRVQKLCEDINDAFQMDDATATSVSISDPKVSYTLDVYEQKIRDWADRLPDDLKNEPKLKFFQDVASLYLHEIAMHVNHNVDDFRMPFTEDTLRSGLESSEVLTQKQMAALEACLSASHNLLTIYSSFSLQTLHNLPSLFYFVRCVYALVVLIKMHLAVTAPGSEVGKVIKREDIKANEFLDKIWFQAKSMSISDSVRPHRKVLRILGALREWFNALEEGETGQKGMTMQDAAARAEAPPHGRYKHGHGGDSRLQVLSEAATAGAHSPSQQATHPSNQNWTYDSASPLVYNNGTGRPSVQSGSSNCSGPPTYGSSSNTTYHYGSASASTQGSSSARYGASGALSDKPQVPQSPYSFTSPGSGGDNSYDWIAGMDLEQVLGDAFRDFDGSGDLGQWFLGDGVGAYQIPSEGAPTSTLGQGHGNDEGQNRW